MSVVSSNLCVGPSPKTKISFLLLSTCTEELISTRNIIRFLPNPTVANEKVPLISNPMAYLEYLYLLTSAFFTDS